jgi:hypothetical protein
MLYVQVRPAEKSDGGRGKDERSVTQPSSRYRAGKPDAEQCGKCVAGGPDPLGELVLGAKFDGGIARAVLFLIVELGANLRRQHSRHIFDCAAQAGAAELQTEQKAAAQKKRLARAWRVRE